MKFLLTLKFPVIKVNGEVEGSQAGQDWNKLKQVFPRVVQSLVLNSDTLTSLWTILADWKAVLPQLFPTILFYFE